LLTISSNGFQMCNQVLQQVIGSGHVLHDFVGGGDQLTTAVRWQSWRLSICFDNEVKALHLGAQIVTMADSPHLGRT